MVAAQAAAVAETVARRQLSVLQPSRCCGSAHLKGRSSIFDRPLTGMVSNSHSFASHRNVAL